jgi:hypothetical protein
MDLMDLKPKSDTIDVELVHPVSLEPITNDDGSNMTIKLFATHSKQYRLALHEQQDSRIKKSQKDGVNSISAADIEQDTLSLLANITCEWDITYNKEKPKLSVNKAKSLYEDVLWLRSQVEEALNKNTNFLEV